MNITFGLTETRAKSTEKYDTPVLTMNAFKGTGTGRKFSFNPAAVAALGLTDSSTLVFARVSEPSGERDVDIVSVFILDASQVSTEVIPEKLRRRIAKTDVSFSNKTDFDKIAKEFNVNVEVENEFALIIEELAIPGTEGVKAGRLALIVEGLDTSGSEDDGEIAEALAEGAVIEAHAQVIDAQEVAAENPFMNENVENLADAEESRTENVSLDA